MSFCPGRCCLPERGAIAPPGGEGACHSPDATGIAKPGALFRHPAMQNNAAAPESPPPRHVAPQPPDQTLPDLTVHRLSLRFRDRRLDVFRGLALLMIYIDHLPGNLWSEFTLQNFGLSDAAEAFVLISGISAGLAYGDYFRGTGRIAAGLRRVWGRAWTIYLVHILVTMLALAGAAALALGFDLWGLTKINRIDVILADPLQFFLRMPLLTFHIDYADILPLYIVLLIFTPPVLWLAWRVPLLALGLSVALWAVAGTLKINLPTLPREFGWFFNPLAWQLLFVIGLLAGVAWRDGRRLVPVRRWLLLPAAGFLIVSLAVAQSAAGTEWFYHELWLAGRIGWPDAIVSMDKTYLALLRLGHGLALAYVLSGFHWVDRACASRFAAPFALLGRHGLAVFATGSVLSILMQGIKADYWRENIGLDSLMLGGGALILLALAFVLDRWPRHQKR